METTQKQIVLGILAHVDSGKTTLSEAMLYRAGAIRKLGRVDHGVPFWTPTAWKKRAASPSFPSRRCLRRAIPPSPCWTPRPCGFFHRD